MNQVLPPGTLIKYRTLRDPNMFSIENNTLFVYGIIIGYDLRSRLGDLYYQIYWISKKFYGVTISSIYSRSEYLHVIRLPQ